MCVGGEIYKDCGQNRLQGGDIEAQAHYDAGHSLRQDLYLNIDSNKYESRYNSQRIRKKIE